MCLIIVAVLKGFGSSHSWRFSSEFGEEMSVPPGGVDLDRIREKLLHLPVLLFVVAEHDDR